MDLFDFNQHCIEARAQIAGEVGILLMVRCTDNYSVLLYDMGKYYSEIWYNPENNSIANVFGFTRSTRLEPYLDMININDLHL